MPKEILTIFMGKVRLRHLWHIFFIALAVYILFNYFYFIPIVFNVTTTLITIFVISLTMYTSNDVVRKASEKQTKEFITKLDETVDQLKQVNYNLSTMAERESSVMQQHINMLKPKLRIKIIDMSYLFLFRHKHITIENLGGEAKEIHIEYGKPDTSVEKEIYTMNVFRTSNLKSGSLPLDLDAGDVSSFVTRNKLLLQIEVWDLESRKYSYNGEIEASSENTIEELPLTTVT